MAAGHWLSTPLTNFILGSSLGREGAGPAIVISFMIAAIACGFAALCYAELASMIPVSGSAYTFAYASLGEVIAWIIGWDLILEYAVGNIAVAVSWSDHFLHLVHGFDWTGLTVMAYVRYHHGALATGGASDKPTISPVQQF
ncbi:MAG: amino acid permease [Candidatus Obscuribacter sp.]|nr:amino acid permease [Candidatus Obscuribacter sp.]